VIPEEITGDCGLKLWQIENWAICHWQTFLHWNKLEKGMSHHCRMCALQLSFLACTLKVANA